MVNIDRSYFRTDTPTVGIAPWQQVHLHSTGNANSAASGEASYMERKDLNGGFYQFVVGNGVVYQTSAVGRGSWDVGGDWNFETYAAIELIESHKTFEEFIVDYKNYIDLARQLASDGNIQLTLDTPALNGIKTHNYASATGHGSDHVDPLPYLAKWGISKEKLASDLANGFGSEIIVVPPVVENPNEPSASGAIAKFRAAGDKFTMYNTFTANRIGQDPQGNWCVINDWLAGGSDANFEFNGIPLDILDNKTRGNSEPTQPGDELGFVAPYNAGTIDLYDPASNGIGITYIGYGLVWYDADSALKM